MNRMTMNDTMDEVFNRRHRPLNLGDSDRNRLAELRHEACDGHCVDCGDCIEPEFTDFVFEASDQPFCWECATHAYRECPCPDCVKRSNDEDGIPR
jgi:hypothetical protein